MVTSPNNGSFSNNLTFAQYQSNALPSWLSFDSSSANITSTNPSTSSSDTYTITNTYTGVTGSSFALTTDLNISVTGSSTNSSNDDKHCFGLSSGAECGLVIFAIAFAVIAPIIAIAVIVYCKWKKARKRANRNNVQQVCNQDNAQHQPVQQQDHQPVDIQGMALETEARCIDEVYQTADNQI